jgi:hypothetical protein
MAQETGPAAPSMDAVREVLKRYKGVNSQERQALSFLKTAAAKAFSNDEFTNAYEKQALSLNAYAKTLASKRNAAQPPSSAELNTLKLSYATLLFGRMVKFVAASQEWRVQKSTLADAEQTQALKLFGPLMNKSGAKPTASAHAHIIPDPTMHAVRVALRRYKGVNEPEKVALDYLVKVALGAASNSVFTKKYESYANALANQAAQLSVQPNAKNSADRMRLTGIAVSTFGKMVKYVAATNEWRRDKSTLTAEEQVMARDLFGPLMNVAEKQTVAQVAEAKAEKSPEQLIAEMKTRKLRIELLKKQLAGASITQRHILNAQLDDELRQTAALVTAAKGKELSATRFVPGNAKDVSGSEQQVLEEQVRKQLASFIAMRDRKKEQMEQLPAGGTRNQLFTEMSALNTQIIAANARIELLAQGKDFVPVSTPIGAPPRPVLSLPADAQPSMDEKSANFMFLSLKALLPRRADESDSQYEARLQESLARALARFVVEQYDGATVSEASQKAVKDAATQDAPVIEAEIQAGGIAQDPAAQAMQPIAAAVIAAAISPDPGPETEAERDLPQNTSAVPSTEDDEEEDEEEDDEEERVEPVNKVWYAKMAAAGVAAGAAVLFLLKG